MKLVPTQEGSCKRFLRGMRDGIRTQLVALKIKEFVDLLEWAKRVEQSLALRKKFVHSQIT